MADDVRPEGRLQSPGRGVNDDMQPVDHRTHRVLRRERQVAGGIQKDVHGGGDGAAAAVPEHDQQLQAVVEMFEGVVEAAAHILAEGVAGDADDEQIIGPFVENQFDGDPGVRTPEDRRKRPLQGRRRAGHVAGRGRADRYG